MQWAKNQKGFTIVELLIVIVVIAILAAITIVAYNGIQNRAKQSAAQSRLTQANKKIMAFYVTNSDRYPNDLDEASIDNADNGLQYSVDNNSSPKSYGITSTNGTFSYYVSSTSSSPVSGAYQGHGANGIPPISNLVMNPSAETNLTYWNVGSGTGGAATNTRMTNGGVSGNAYVRQTWTTSSTGGGGGPWVSNTAINTITEGETYSASAWVRTSKAQRMTAYIYWLNAASSSISTIGGAAVVTTPNTWTRLTVTGVAPALAVKFFVVPWSISGTGYSVWNAGDISDADAIMVTKGSTIPAYADGDTSGWAWTATAHGSISNGPAL